MVGSELRRDPDAQPGTQIKPVVWAAGALGVCALALAAVAIPLDAVVFGMPVPLAFVLGAAQPAAIVLALFHPRSAAGISCAAVFVLAAAVGDVGVWPVSVTTLIGHALLVGVLGAQPSWPVGLWCWGGGVVAAFGAAALVPHTTSTGAVIGNLFLFGSVTAGTFALAMFVRQWRRISSQLVQERRLSADEHAKRVIAEEKTRVARELHDVIAHSMSLINVQATTAQYRHPGLDPAIGAEFDEMAAASRQALGEMRSVLGVLRSTQTDGELVPQPGLDRIPELIDSARRAGVDITAHGAELLDERAGSEIAGIAAFRIVQEALSNVTRHAPGARTEVRFERSGDELTITVRNGAPERTANPVQGGGHGLVGMQERAAIVRGELRFGHLDDGGYEVRAVLPLHSNDSQEQDSS
ncbi:histidine kinase [Saccharopolyspora indica]|uniref:sensor histidine kinase n=1 Tax=Saccharopolyspora indica TaxID=1229659 RepID=UPI0022EAA185|nr:histidine kinase [Saccharopolyspora indica]MDA3643924.1 histidine kinase [Saccharopolyspora indica]